MDMGLALGRLCRLSRCGLDVTGRNRVAALSQSSGDLIADRRFEIAAAYAERGDFEAAADLLEQALERAKDWTAAWHALAKVREAQGQSDAAVSAFRRAAALDATDELGASLDLARLGMTPPPEAAPERYVAALFDQYSKQFETHLTVELSYRAPALLAEAVARCASRQFGYVVDLGCGTGLCGGVFRADAEILVGVDLSPLMLGEARAKNIYDALETRSLTGFLEAAAAVSIDLLLAADVLVYVGNLASVFRLAHRALRQGGLFAFTLQKAADDRDLVAGFHIAADLRYSHHRSYVETLARQQGFTICVLEEASSRREAGANVPGLVVVLEKR